MLLLRRHCKSSSAIQLTWMHGTRTGRRHYMLLQPIMHCIVLRSSSHYWAVSMCQTAVDELRCIMLPSMATLRYCIDLRTYLSDMMCQWHKWLVSCCLVRSVVTVQLAWKWAVNRRFEHVLESSRPSPRHRLNKTEQIPSPPVCVRWWTSCSLKEPTSMPSIRRMAARCIGLLLWVRTKHEVMKFHVLMS